MEPWEGLHREPEEIIDLGGDRVLVLHHITARGSANFVEEGVKHRWRQDEAFRAAGPSE
jgi:hypothetical protein